MDVAGKVVYAHNSEILTATLQAAGESPSTVNGDTSSVS